MTDGADLLRVFVAMPGTKMGGDAAWDKPDHIKKHFFQKVCDALADRLKRKVDLVIEKDKLYSGPIHASMFREATEAEVYIADLTGNNPNVYLELGVRWALMDGVTILVSQDVTSIRFNAASNRVIPYGIGPDELERAIEQVAMAVEAGLARKQTHCDSPVRDGQGLIAVPRAELDQLRAEVDRLKQQQGEAVFRAATAANNDAERLRLYRQAVEASPSRVDFRIELAAQLRSMNQYAEAQRQLEAAIKLDERSAIAWRELGVTLGLIARTERKPALLRDATEKLERATQLAPTDVEAHSNLGGALRRLAFADGAASIDWSRLDAAYRAYQRASEISTHNTYARTNIAKLALLLSARDPAMASKATDHYRKVRPLVEFALEDLPSDHEDRIWKRFDLAEALLGIGETKLSLDKYDEAIAATPPLRRTSVFQSVLSPINELLELNAGNPAQKAALLEVRKKLESASKADAPNA